MALQDLLYKRDEDIKRYKEELTASIENNRIFQGENKTLSAKCATFLEANQDQAGAINEMQATIDDHVYKNNQLENIIKELHEEKTGLERQLEEKLVECDDTFQRLKKTQAELREAEHVNNSLSKEALALESEL